MPEYIPQHDPWEDSPSEDTPLNAASLNGMELGIVRASIPTKVTSLPVTPYDGQEVYFEASETAGVYWHLRFRSASASDFKWEFLGGPPLHVEILTAETTTNVAYVDLATAGPSVTVPLEGDYEIVFGCDLRSSADGAVTVASVKLGAAATSDNESVANNSNAQSSVSRVLRENALAASAVLLVQYKSNGSATLTARNRFISVRPIRVI